MNAVKRLLCLLLLAALLPGCSAGAPAAFPPAYSLACQLEAFQGQAQTSCLRFAAAQTAEGFSYAADTGERFLFLLEGPDTYALYIRGPGGALVENPGVRLSGQALAGFQEVLLPLGLLRPDTAGLAPAGTATVAGRPCRIYAGTVENGTFSCWRFCCLDRETGLALASTAQYRSRDGEVFTYRLRCASFPTREAGLPGL